MSAAPPALDGLSLEERVHDAVRLVALITAATSGEGSPVSPEDLRDAIHTAADRAYALLAPLRQAPFPVATWTPADDGRGTG